MAFASISEILDDLRAGKAIVLVDDESRENEGDFVVAAEKMTVEMINFLTRVGAGYLCVAMTAEDCERLDLGPQTGVNTSVRGTAFTVSVDGHPKHGVGTGISARDRAKTIQLLADAHSTVDDFVRPGHINPLRARPGGVLVRTDRPRAPSISAAWRACVPRPPSSRSCLRTARWPAFPTSRRSARSTA